MEVTRTIFDSFTHDIFTVRDPSLNNFCLAVINEKKRIVTKDIEIKEKQKTKYAEMKMLKELKEFIKHENNKNKKEKNKQEWNIKMFLNSSPSMKFCNKIIKKLEKWRKTNRVRIDIAFAIVHFAQLVDGVVEAKLDSENAEEKLKTLAARTEITLSSMKGRWDELEYEIKAWGNQERDRSDELVQKYLETKILY